MNVKQIRAHNLKRLIDERAEGSQRQFADDYQFSKAHISQMVTGHRDMGDKMARKIELACSLRSGEMDRLWEDEAGLVLPLEARQVAADWLLISEPLKSQMSHAIHSAADVARKYGPVASDKYVGDHLQSPPEATKAKDTKKKA